MTRASSWTVEGLFHSVVGVAMAVFLAGACVVGQRAPTVGSGLVPAAVLEKLLANGRLCQTVTEHDIVVPGSPG